MPKVTYNYDGQTKTVEGANGETLLQIGLDNGIPIEHACGGNGFCTTCLCKTKAGAENLSERNDREDSMGIVNEDERLSCQAEVNGDTTVELVEF